MQKREAKWKTMRSRRIRILPTAEQKLLLKAAFEACRHVYNKTIEAINAKACKANRTAMRKVSVNKEVWDKTEKDKAWNVADYELRDGAMLDAFKAVKSTNESMAARGEPTGNQWKFKGRKKKDKIESIAIRSRQLNDSELPFYKQLFGRSGARINADGNPTMESVHPLPDVYEADVRIWHHKVLDEYFLIVPEEAPVIPIPSMDAAPDTQGCRMQRGSCVSIDPGVRTFATCYDPDGLVCKWGCAGADGSPSANAKLWRIANIANSIRARLQNPKLRTNKVGRGKRHRRRRRMRRAAARIEKRLRDMVNELSPQACAVVVPQLRGRAAAGVPRFRDGQEEEEEGPTWAQAEYRAADGQGAVQPGALPIPRIPQVPRDAIRDAGVRVRRGVHDADVRSVREAELRRRIRGISLSELRGAVRPRRERGAEHHAEVCARQRRRPVERFLMPQSHARRGAGTGASYFPLRNFPSEWPHHMRHF
jgi:transposase